MKNTLLMIGIFTSLVACSQKTAQNNHFPIQKSDAEWKQQLTSEQYEVVRQKGTETAFTGAYWDNKLPGTYHCVACNSDLFHSETKITSGTGWPSFYAPVKNNQVIELTDTTFGWIRTEVLCANCGGHLGHKFNDGPQPTGLRYCVNSASLIFTEKK